MGEANWNFYLKLAELIQEEKNAAGARPATAMENEFKRLAKQKCPFCSGYGHSGDLCPTDWKIAKLRGGIREQNQILTSIRKKLREEAGMKNVSGFSLLSATKPMAGRKRRHHEMAADSYSANDASFMKRTRFV